MARLLAQRVGLPDRTAYLVPSRPMVAAAAEHLAPRVLLAVLEVAVGKAKAAFAPEELLLQDKDRTAEAVTAQSQRVRVVEVVVLARQDQTERLE